MHKSVACNDPRCGHSPQCFQHPLNKHLTQLNPGLYSPGWHPLSLLRKLRDCEVQTRLCACGFVQFVLLSTLLQSFSTL
ncbi:Uncharacterized protein HZ326_7805 [Fusarium oxysporum f. sp. albedinis]|nr:Uncharacterized protein HZ326_7805 [Fusarium oxysporum f. sp. albedinis]